MKPVIELSFSRCALIYTGYLLLALLAMVLTRSGQGIASLWLANALGIALIYPHPVRHWPVLLGCVALANISAELLFADALPVALYFSISNLLEISIGAALLHRYSNVEQLDTDPRILLAVVLKACVLPAIPGATLGALGLSQLQLGQYGDLWLTWFASSCTGSVAILPILLPLQHHGWNVLRRDLDPLLTPVLLMISLAVSALALLYLPFPFVYLSLPLLLSSFLLGFTHVALANACMGILLSGMLSQGLFIPPPFTANWQSLLIYMPILATLLPPLLFSASHQQARQRELAFRLSEQRFRGALAFAGTGFALAGPDGLIREANQRLCQIFGYTRDELIGTHHLDLCHPEDRHLSETHLAKLLNGDCHFYALDKRVLNSKGTPFWVHMTVSLLPGADGESELIVQIDDITEKVEAQHKLNQLRIAAEKANRTKSEFLANMSHEIRTPMNGVLGIAQLLERTELSATQRKYLDMLRDAGHSLLAVINDILDFSKIEAGRLQLNPKPFELDELTERMASLMTVLAESRDLELLIRVEPQVPRTLLADRHRLEQILTNLIGNAIKFTEAGEVELLIGLRPHNGTAHLHISVRDTGVGIAAGQRESIFEAFEQADGSHTRRYGGSGLGLAICKRLVQLMGGRIWLEHSSPQGSEFCVSLPLPSKQSEPASLPQSPALTGLHVLLADDNPRSRQILWQLLSDYRCSVDCVASGAEAVERFQSTLHSGSHYQLLLIDWNMADFDGLQTLRRMGELSTRPLPPHLLMINAFSREQLLSAGDKLPGSRLLLKPVTRRLLEQQLLETLNPTGATAPAEAPPTPGELTGIRLLLVEDNLLNQMVAQSMLELQGARITLAADGLQAVERLRAQPDGFDAVLMDVQMPGMDGFTATRLIRGELGLKLPILAMSAGVTHNEREDCIASGMDDFIAKPIELDTLLAKLAQYLQTPKALPATMPASEPARPALFNPDSLQRLCAADPTVHRSMATLVQDVLDAGQTPVEEIRQAFLAGDHTTAAQLVHRLRGGLGTLGGTGLQQPTLQLETSLKERNSDTEGLIEELAALHEQVLAAMAEWLNHNPPPA